jgi:quercetin dioxygenase-like cupin family protein
MSTTTAPRPLVRNADATERRWFYGGGIHTWLATSTDTGGAFLLFEDDMEEGKLTPLHTHPSDETFYVLEGELLVHLDGAEHAVRAGGVSVAPRGVPHAFKVVSPRARLLCLHTPGTCEGFYMGASDPIAAGVETGPVDFDRIAASGRENGGFELVGPPPF